MDHQTKAEKLERFVDVIDAFRVSGGAKPARDGSDQLDQIRAAIRRHNAEADRYRSSLMVALRDFLGTDAAVLANGRRIAEASELFALVLSEHLEQLAGPAAEAQ